MKILPVLSLFAAFTVLGCSHDDAVKDISKDGAVETVLTVDHLNDSLDILTTQHAVWVKNKLVKTIIYKDTLPTLGASSQVAENNNGESQSVYLKKDYELYITVK